MTPYDENLLLKKLNALVDNEPMSADDRPVEARMVDGVKIKRNQMRRKLLLRKVLCRCLWWFSAECQLILNRACLVGSV